MAKTDKRRARAKRREAARWNEAQAAADKILSPGEIAAEAARIVFPPPPKRPRTQTP